MSIESTPIRLIMFTSETCVYCPPIESIVKEIVGTSMQDLVHVSTVDVDDDPEASSQYDIQALPTLVIDDEIVLEGGMEDDEVRDLLWNTLLNKAVGSEEALEQTKSSMLALTINAMDSLNGSRLLRPSVGDFTHIGVFQLNLLSLYSLDPLIPLLLYRAGHQLGMYGMMHHVLTLLNPKLGQSPKRDLRFKHLAYALELYFSDREILPTLLAESAEVIDITESKIDLKVNDMASASLRVNVGEPLCGFTAGQLAGVSEAVMGVPAKCEEVKCMAMGEEYCLFRIEIGMDQSEPSLPPLEDKEERKTRRMNFYEYIHETTQLINDSLLMRNVMRSEIGDFMHISVLQPVIVSLKLLDRFSASLLYSGGRELGVFGPGKPLLYRLVKDRDINIPTDLKSGVELLHQYLTHPTTMLGRDYGQVNLIENEEGNSFIIEIEENASIAGLSNAGIGQTFCDFQAGFYAGRINILIGLDPIVNEIACQGNGSQTCRFEIKVQRN